MVFPSLQGVNPPRLLLLIMGCLGLLVSLSARAQESLFPPSKTAPDSGPEGTPYELGMIFRADRDGTITHLRVYALATESGPHTARLWRNSNSQFVGGPYDWTFGGATGWITLDIPDVPVLADTDYTVVVSTGGGGQNYPFIDNDLASPGGNGQHLTYPANAGVFSTSLGVRPTSVFQSSNYLRDVVFVPEPLDPPTDEPVRINEFLAENNTSYKDEDGDSSDWLELYNPKSTPVEIGGYQLVDGANTWTLPTTTLGAQSFLVIFASGKNRSTLPLHANFKLDGGGELLALKNSVGAVISEFAPAFPNQKQNVSYGRGSAGNIGYMPEPTPGAANGEAFSGYVLDTTFSVKRGFFSAPIEVAVTTGTPGATIRYTVNGSTPTESSTAYTGSLTIGATTTLRVRAFKPDFIPTNTDTNTYVFTSDLIQQTNASTRAYGWPSGPVNGQVLRYGLNASLQPLYSQPQKLAALVQIPTLSLVTDQALLTGAAGGVYVNAQTDGLEHPTSFELIHPDGTPGFQIDAGLRIRGGQSRGGNFPKHSFNLFFRAEYGAGKLKFPLFGPNGANEFDTLSLRCEHGYAYADPYPLDVRLSFTAMRDVFCREMWAAAGYESTRSSYYHLLLNGQYWGLYQTQERAQEDFGATYFGGRPEEYDAVAATGLPQLQTVSTSGDLVAWTQLWSGARAVNATPTNTNYFKLLGRNADGTPNAALPVFLDPQELAAYMLVHYYTGHADEPLSVSFNWEKPNNFRAMRRRGMTEPWHFLVHDGESSMLANEWFNNRANAVNLTSPNRNNINFSNPEWIHEDLLANGEYRIAFADMAQRLLFNDAAFTQARAQPYWDALASHIDQAVIGESLRWGQSTAESQSNWVAEVNRVRAQFFPTRTATVISQLRSSSWRGFSLLSSVNAPVFSQRGGQVVAGFQLTLSAPGGGSIYYTLDGGDPRAIGGGVAGTTYNGDITINAPTLVRARFRSDSGEWSALDEAFFTTFTPAIAGNLVVSKVHYHPLPPSAVETSAGFNAANDFEYLEFQNVTTEMLDLRGVAVNAGVTFAFTDATIKTLSAGERVVVAENSAAFAARYGAGLPVAGAFTGNLSDGGETVRVVDGDGAIISQFTYGDSSPWPALADGQGPALVLKAANLDPALSTSWRPSYSFGGKPGELDVLTIADWRAHYFSAADLGDPAKEANVWGHLADPDNDGRNNLLELGLVGVPTDGASQPLIVSEVAEDPPGGAKVLRATYRIREGVSDVTVTAEIGSDPGNSSSWQALTPLTAVSQGDNSALVTVQDPQPLTGNPRRFIHLKVTTP